MKKLLTACLAAGVLGLAPAALGHDGDDPGPRYLEVQEFAKLPLGARNPEGIAANPATGEIYVGTLNFGGLNLVLRFEHNGKISDIRVTDGSAPLLGLGFDRDKLYVLNFGAGKVQRIAANFNAGTPWEDVAVVPTLPPPPPRVVGPHTIVFGPNGKAPNAMVFDRAGNIYFSDSFQGAIFRIDNPSACAPACAVTTVKQDGLLATVGFPPFGANGVALNADESVLFVANTGDDRIFKIALTLPGMPIATFAESANGADGILFDGGLLWVANNQSDQVVALDEEGRVVVIAGDFRGLTREGAPRGLLFPASLALARGHIYVVNLALALTPMAGDEPEEDVRRWNVMRFKPRD
jgi:sugar lactone lactonase YvrE